MNKRIIIFVSVGAIVALVVLGVFLEPTQSALGYLRGDQFYNDRSASYWRKVLRSEDTSSLRSVEMVPFLIEALGNRNPVIRGRAAIALGDNGPAAKEAVPALLKACTDPDGKIAKMTLRLNDHQVHIERLWLSGAPRSRLQGRRRYLARTCRP